MQDTFCSICADASAFFAVSDGQSSAKLRLCEVVRSHKEATSK